MERGVLWFAMCLRLVYLAAFCVIAWPDAGTDHPWVVPGIAAALLLPTVAVATLSRGGPYARPHHGVIDTAGVCVAYLVALAGDRTLPESGGVAILLSVTMVAAGLAIVSLRTPGRVAVATSLMSATSIAFAFATPTTSTERFWATTEFALLGALLVPLALHMRRSFAELDATRAQLAEAQGALARQEERNRLHRLLHDGAIQTLEALSAGWTQDLDGLRAVAGREAAALRGLIEAEEPATGTLADGLRRVLSEADLRGVHARLDMEPLPAEPAHTVRAAVCAAVGEALTNVAKHAGTTSALVTVRGCAERLDVRVRDDGRGFDPEVVSGRLGLRSSLGGRIREVGGVVEVESAPAAGTTVRIAVPLC